jgi:hypothetical protein
MFTWRVAVASARFPANVGNGSTNFGIEFPLNGVCPKVTEAVLAGRRLTASRRSPRPQATRASIVAASDTDADGNR